MGFVVLAAELLCLLAVVALTYWLCLGSVIRPTLLSLVYLLPLLLVGLAVPLALVTSVFDIHAVRPLLPALAVPGTPRRDQWCRAPS